MTEKIIPPKVKIIRGEYGCYWGYIYGNNRKLLEKTGGKSGFWQELNAITYTNQRVDFWRKLKKLDIPYYVKEFPDENA